MKSSIWTVAKLLQTQVYYYRWEFNQALIQAARRGDLITVRWELGIFRHCQISKDVVEEATRPGHLGILQMLEAAKIHAGIQWSGESLNLAATSGNWDLVHWLYSRNQSTLEAKQANTQLVNSACGQHKLEEVKWAIGFGASELSFSHCTEENWRLQTEKYWNSSWRGRSATLCKSLLARCCKL